MKQILETASKSIWKEVRELALKKGTETLVSEGIKSVIEIAKRSRIRRDEYEFAEWKKAQQPPEEKDDKGSKKKAKAESSDESSDASESDEAKEESAAEPAKPEEPDPHE